nr:eukaryotic translation initiation factor 4E type 2-like isoform X1 [Oncorhynchus nerka]
MNQFEHLKDDDLEDQDETVCNREEDCSINNNRRKTVSPAVGEHPLQYNYTLWYSRRTPSRPANTQSYEQNIRQIGTVASVEQFWKFYSHLVRPGDLTGHSDFHLFKEGIKPMWEDEANKNGGKWIIRLRKGLASRFWENIILAMLGEQFMVGEEICGVVVSIRFQVYTHIHTHTHRLSLLGPKPFIDWPLADSDHYALRRCPVDVPLVIIKNI